MSFLRFYEHCRKFAVIFFISFLTLLFELIVWRAYAHALFYRFRVLRKIKISEHRGLVDLSTYSRSVPARPRQGTP